MLEFDICFKDINPDTGEEKTTILGTSKELKGAMWIKTALEMHWLSGEGENDPNREFFVQEREVNNNFEEDE